MSFIADGSVPQTVITNTTLTVPQIPEELTDEPATPLFEYDVR